MVVEVMLLHILCAFVFSWFGFPVAVMGAFSIEDMMEVGLYMSACQVKVWCASVRQWDRVKFRRQTVSDERETRKSDDSKATKD